MRTMGERWTWRWTLRTPGAAAAAGAILLGALAPGCTAAAPEGTDGGAPDAAMSVADGRAATVDLSGVDFAPLCGAPQCSPGDLCQTATGCCSCGPFARACLPGWTCAQPALNDPRCPPAAPALYGGCGLPDGVLCWYCGNGAPVVAACASALTWSECQATGSARCWIISGPTRGCD